MVTANEVCTGKALRNVIQEQGSPAAKCNMHGDCFLGFLPRFMGILSCFGETL